MQISLMASLPADRTLVSVALAVTLLSGCSFPLPRETGAPVEDRLPEPSGSPQPAQAPAWESRTAYPAPKSEPVTRPAPAIRPRMAYLLETPKENTGTAAVATLLRKAESADSPQAAAATLERALRIEPDNPLVWNRLAKVRLEQGRPEQAEATAMKSNALAADRPALWPENWGIIADARSRQGDDAGAAEARVKRRNGSR